MTYFKRKAAYPRRRTEETAKNWDKLWQQYRKHLRSIKNALPESAWLLANLTFHDATVQRVQIPSKREIVITLYRGRVGSPFRGGNPAIPEALLEAEWHTLSFTGVKKAWVPYSIVGDIWVYEEVHLSELAAFDYQVLLDRDEIRIQADEVKISASAG